MSKLKSVGEHRSTEMAGFIDGIENMKKLWGIKLTTPLEELQSMVRQVQFLRARNKDLEADRNLKQEALHKYLEESAEKKA